MNILIIGSGGREHSMFTTFKLDPRIDNIYMVGQNGAIDSHNLIAIDGMDFHAVYETIIEKQIDLTVVGPEVYLEAGIVDYLRAHKCDVVGPDKFCAQLESSKNFAKEMMERANIPTAKYQFVQTVDEGLGACQEFGYPIVLKYDGLAAGKGVAICQNEKEAHEYLVSTLETKVFGDDGIVVEECLVGEEYSVFAICNGTNYALLPVAQDYKRAFDNDQGPNTGGMGANTTSKFDHRLDLIEDDIIKLLLAEFETTGYKYTGFLYVGLMETKEGPKVIEFNVRMGDPETQIVMQKLDEKLLSIIERVNSGETFRCKLKPEEYVGVVLAAAGYPTGHLKDVILELNKSMHPIFHMGTKLKDEQLLSTGGRVMMITSSGSTIEEARTSVYQKVDQVNNDSLFFRTDIGLGRI